MIAPAQQLRLCLLLLLLLLLLLQLAHLALWVYLDKLLLDAVQLGLISPSHGPAHTLQK
jgi:hypothetical protein